MPFQPPPANFPNHLSAPDRLGGRLPGRYWLLAGLVLLCLVPRAVMAWRIPALSPDGVLYVRLAESLEAGRVSEAVQKMHLNLFPMILAVLHRAGLDWQAAGAAWNVIVASCVVLPLFGWTRRQFDDRVALAACFLYAVHGELVRWSPEVLRDPTFWFLFTLSLYLLWRAVAEVRVLWFLAAGLSIALASLTRFEGLFLLLPLALWSLTRWQALPQFRGRLVLGVLACIAVFPLLLTAAATLWLRRHAPWELFRWDPLTLLPIGVPTPMQPESGGLITQWDWSFPQPRPAVTHILGILLPTLIKGLNPLFMLLAAAGIWRWRKIWNRGAHRAMTCTSAVVLAAVAVHVWSAQTSCTRYVFPVVIMTAPFAALGLLDVSARLVKWAAARQSSTALARLVGGAPAVVAVVLAVMAAFSHDFGTRASKAALGHWIAREFGPSTVLFGPHGTTQVVNYYAQGTCYSVPAWMQDEALESYVRQCSPGIVLWPAQRGPCPPGCDVQRRLEDFGFVHKTSWRLAPSNHEVLVLVHAAAARQAEVVAQSRRGAPGS